MQIIDTEIPDVKVIVPRRYKDARGYFAETYNQKILREIGIEAAFVQDNQSMSAEAGVVRGLHFQIAPMAQVKLVRILRGAILDVALDIRRGSPTFGRHVSVRLNADDGKQVLIPLGFAHGFATLEPNTEVFYKVSNYYSPTHERGIRWNDPALGIDWGVDEKAAILSERDRVHPMFQNAADLFD
jgi:dTDP-4-dehydrorhamnose 3,5-epimerase